MARTVAASACNHELVDHFVISLSGDCEPDSVTGQPALAIRFHCHLPLGAWTRSAASCPAPGPRAPSNRAAGRCRPGRQRAAEHGVAGLQGISAHQVFGRSTARHRPLLVEPAVGPGAQHEPLPVRLHLFVAPRFSRYGAWRRAASRAIRRSSRPSDPCGPNRRQYAALVLVSTQIPLSSLVSRPETPDLVRMAEEVCDPDKRSA